MLIVRASNISPCLVCTGIIRTPTCNYFVLSQPTDLPPLPKVDRTCSTVLARDIDSGQRVLVLSIMYRTGTPATKILYVSFSWEQTQFH